MLVLSRMEGEFIQVGDDVEIYIIRIGRDRVRVGVKAPKDVLILRSELVGKPALPAHDRRLKRLEEGGAAS